MLLDIGSMGQYAKKLLEIEHDFPITGGDTGFGIF